MFERTRFGELDALLPELVVQPFRDVTAVPEEVVRLPGHLRHGLPVVHVAGVRRTARSSP